MCVCHCHCHLHISTPQQNDICNSQLLSLFGTTPVRLRWSLCRGWNAALWLNDSSPGSWPRLAGGGVHVTCWLCDPLFFYGTIQQKSPDDIKKQRKKSEMKQLGFDVGWSFSWSTTVQVEMSTWIKVFFSRMRNESLEESIQLIQFFHGGCGRKFLAFVCWQWLVSGLLTTPKPPGYDMGLSENRYSQSIWIIRIFPINMAKVGDVVYLYTPFFIQPPYFVRHTWGCSSSCKWIYILWSYPLTIIDKHYQYWPWLYSYY